MAKLSRLPTIGRDAEAQAEQPRVPRLRTRYYAFLSYSHRDKDLADWLHRELERFRVPRTIAGKLTANGVVPHRLVPIFRDQHDLSAGGELADEIKAALAASQFLVVLCSPTAAKSRWTNTEIESFKRTRPEGCVLAAVVAGEPFASEIPGREDEECFPPALRFKYDRRGHQTTKRAEPLAADFREGGDGRRTAFLKLVAGMLGVGLDELVQREQTRRHRSLAWLAAGSLAGMAVTSTLAVTAIQARDAARDQRREAEGLVAFMLGDLKDKLEPIGKLDALDGVGARVLAYYSKQDMSDLSDAALLQRSKALTLMAQVADARGDSEDAVRLYRQAMIGTAETMRRNPQDPQAIFDHAQNVFYIGQIAYQRGRLDEAAAEFGEYKQLADRMVSLGPDNMKWRMEVQNALADLGSVRLAQRRFGEGATLSEQALHTIEALTTADPNNREYTQSLVEALAWSADAERDAGHIDQAVALRERHVALLNRLLSQTGDVSYRQRLVPGERSLGTLYAMRGQLAPAVQHMQFSIQNADALIPMEPNNNKWLEYAAKARNNFAYVLLISGKTDEASQQNEASCAAYSRLLAKDSSLADWRAGLRECWLMRAYIAFASGNNAAAAAAADQAIVIARSVKTADSGADAFARARSYQLLGDARKGLGDSAGAFAAWTAALQAIPRVTAERPVETQEHAIILERLGRTAEAERLNRQLAAIGYRLPEVRRL
jgi:tetratricopeptide (TPR) repeat protein